MECLRTAVRFRPPPPSERSQQFADVRQGSDFPGCQGNPALFVCVRHRQDAPGPAQRDAPARVSVSGLGATWPRAITRAFLAANSIAQHIDSTLQVSGSRCCRSLRKAPAAHGAKKGREAAPRGGCICNTSKKLVQPRMPAPLKQP